MKKNRCPFALVVWWTIQSLCSALLLATVGGVVAEAAPFAYVTNPASGTVSVIDTATNTVVATVLVEGWPQGVAITPGGAFAYVANAANVTWCDDCSGICYESWSSSVIGTSTNTVAASVWLNGCVVGYCVGPAPTSVAITPDGAFAYMTNWGIPAWHANRVAVLDTPTNTTVASVWMGNDGIPYGVAISPDGAFAYVTNTANPSGFVAVLNTATKTVVATVLVGGGPRGVAVTPDGAFAYVTNQFSDSVSVIDTASVTVLSTVPMPVGSSPFGVAITPTGAFAYVTHSAGNAVSIIETASNTVVGTVPVGTGPAGVAITPDGAFAYVANAGSNTVSVIDTASNTVVATVAVGTQPMGVAISPI
jgi:YVTN family beta-propeller protein